MRKGKILIFATAWMDLEHIIPSEISQAEKILKDMTYMWNLKKLSP